MAIKPRGGAKGLCGRAIKKKNFFFAAFRSLKVYWSASASALLETLSGQVCSTISCKLKDKGQSEGQTTQTCRGIGQTYTGDRTNLYWG